MAADLAEHEFIRAILEARWSGEQHTRPIFLSEAGRSVRLHCRGDPDSRYFWVEKITVTKKSRKKLKEMGEENAVSFLVEQLRAMKEASLLIQFQREFMRDRQADWENITVS